VPDAALDDAAREFLATDVASFTTPGHGRNPAVADAFLALDLPLTSAIDDLRESKGMLAAAEARAARAWGADWCRFIVNGSSQANQAMALGVARPGATVIVSRTIHKSLFAAFVLGGLNPVFVRPELDPRTGLPGGMPPQRIADALAAHPGASAVFLTEPSYVGVLSDVAAIAGCCREAGVPLLVDGAWGAHLGFHPGLPQHALALGADALVVSTHKTLPAFTQSALLMARGESLDLRRLGEAFELFNTTSPSGAIYASIDRARGLLEHDGVELLDRTLRQAERVRAVLEGIEGVRLVRADAPAVHVIDPTKIVISLDGTGADGFAVEADAYEAGLRFEMVDRSLLVPLLHVGVSDVWVDRLLEFLPAAIARRRGTPRPPLASVAFTAHPEAGMSPREAFFADHERVPVAQAIGRICAETVTPYPPGIPALAPGEVVSKHLIDALRDERAAGSRISYCSDPSLDTLVVVRR
jgi:arginine decarboxylase